jgi:membrane protein DedA with SNARE-associated domain
MALIWRILLVLTAPVAALFISREALNFDIIQTLIAVILIALLLLLVAFWKLRPPADRSSAN